MVCDRCKYVIQNILKAMDINAYTVTLGEIDLGSLELSKNQLDHFREKIEALGFELICDKKSRLIEDIKQHIIAYTQRPVGNENLKLSQYLSNKLFHDYSYLSNLFSSVEGVTIEQHLINQKIEKVKELLVYDELTLTEISYQLNYSSVAHISRQFKKVTGQTPSQFKSLRDNSQRSPLNKV